MTKERRKRRDLTGWLDCDYLDYWESRSIATASGCLEWQGFTHKGPPHKNGPTCKGYPSDYYRGKAVRITRIILGWKLGRPLAAKERACHSCDNTICINHEHLWSGSDKDNMQDAGQKKRWPRQYRGHCINGHPRTPENVLLHGSSKKMVCRPCLLARYAAMPEDKYQKMLARQNANRRARLAKQRLAQRSQSEPEPNVPSAAPPALPRA